MDGNAVIGDFSTPLTSIDRSSRWKINKAPESPEWHNKTVRFNCYLEDITYQKQQKPKTKTEHTLSKCTRIIL